MNRPFWSISPGSPSKPSNCSAGAGFRFIEIDYSERDTLACNVLSLGSKRLIALEENVRTNQRLREAGFDVRTFPGPNSASTAPAAPPA